MGSTPVIKKLMTCTFCFAVALTPAVLSAGGLSVALSESVVTQPEDTTVVPVIGSLNGGLIAGAAVLALVALASSGGSTSATNGTN